MSCSSSGSPPARLQSAARSATSTAQADSSVVVLAYASPRTTSSSSALSGLFYSLTRLVVHAHRQSMAHTAELTGVLNAVMPHQQRVLHNPNDTPVGARALALLVRVLQAFRLKVVGPAWGILRSGVARESSKAMVERLAAFDRWDANLRRALARLGLQRSVLKLSQERWLERMNDFLRLFPPGPTGKLPPARVIATRTLSQRTLAFHEKLEAAFDRSVNLLEERLTLYQDIVAAQDLHFPRAGVMGGAVAPPKLMEVVNQMRGQRKIDAVNKDEQARRQSAAPRKAKDKDKDKSSHPKGSRASDRESAELSSPQPSPRHRARLAGSPRGSRTGSPRAPASPSASQAGSPRLRPQRDCFTPFEQSRGVGRYSHAT